MTVLTEGPGRLLDFDGFDLNEAMFAPAVMLAGGELAFDVMKLPQLKEELASRDSSRSGLKAALQRRLHGLLVQAAIARHVEEARRRR